MINYFLKHTVFIRTTEALQKKKNNIPRMSVSSCGGSYNQTKSDFILSSFFPKVILQQQQRQQGFNKNQHILLGGR
jgi:predicted esterase